MFDTYLVVYFSSPNPKNAIELYWAPRLSKHVENAYFVWIPDKRES